MAQEYCIKKDLIFNICKTKEMALERHKNAVLGPPNPAMTESIKHLGMTIDHCPTWNVYLESLCRKSSTEIIVPQKSRKNQSHQYCYSLR